MKSVELFDALDRNGEPTGELKTKQQILSDGDWRNVTHVWVANAPQQIITQQRAIKGMWDGLWDITVGGGVSAGEEPKHAAVRELGEELGIEASESELRLLGKIETTKFLPELDLEAREFSTTFLLSKAISLSSLVLQKREVVAVDEIHLNDLRATIADDEQYKKWMPHPKAYYLGVIAAIEALGAI